MRKILVCIVFSVGVVACSSNDSAEKITEPLCSTPSIECLLPWPNDALTVFEKTADKNGRQLNLQEAWMPTNATEKPIDVTDMNRANGFSPGSAILLLVPGVNLAASKLPTSDHIEDSLNKDAGIVITDQKLGSLCPMVYDTKNKQQIAGMEMQDLETLGIIKFDILGVAMLDKVMAVSTLLKNGGSYE